MSIHYLFYINKIENINNTILNKNPSSVKYILEKSPFYQSAYLV